MSSNNYEQKVKVLTGAVLRTAEILGLTYMELADIIGISPSGVTRLR